jgi:hypothetical protein
MTTQCAFEKQVTMVFFHDLTSIGKLTMNFWWILMFKVSIVINFLEPPQLCFHG